MAQLPFFRIPGGLEVRQLNEGTAQSPAAGSATAELTLVSAPSARSGKAATVPLARLHPLPAGRGSARHAFRSAPDSSVPAGSAAHVLCLFPRAALRPAARGRSLRGWVGNFDGSAVRGISGSEHAGSPLSELFRTLEGDSGAWRKPRGLQLDSVALCAVSRDLLGGHCDATIQAEHLPDRSRLARCDWHRTDFVDRSGGHVLSGDCSDGRPYERRVLTVHLPEQQAWRRVGSQTVVPLPRVSADSGGVQVGAVPRIVSPQAGTPYCCEPMRRRDTRSSR